MTPPPHSHPPRSGPQYPPSYRPHSTRRHVTKLQSPPVHRLARFEDRAQKLDRPINIWRNRNQREKPLREFGAGWLDAVPDLSLHIEAFCVQGDTVCDMGRMSGTITKDYFGLPGTGRRFDCQFSQICFVEKGRIKYLRGLWNAADMYNQVGWDLAGLKR